MNEIISESDDVIIRGVMVRDVADLHGLCQELGYDTPASPLPKRLIDIVFDDNQAMYVAELTDTDDRRVIGFVHVFGRYAVEIEPCAQIQALVVSERARRRGVADKLIKAVEAWARLRGLGWLSLYCTTTRDDAHAFYPSLGFEAASEATRFNKQLD